MCACFVNIYSLDSKINPINPSLTENKILIPLGQDIKKKKKEKVALVMHDIELQMLGEKDIDIFSIFSSIITLIEAYSGKKWEE